MPISFAEFFGEKIFKNHNIGPWSPGRKISDRAEILQEIFFFFGFIFLFFCFLRYVKFVLRTLQCKRRFRFLSTKGGLGP
jgi:hypothetical protein